MKLPRWLVIAALTTSVLAVLAAAGWWWVTWPERTARSLVRVLVEGNSDAVRRMTRSESHQGSYILNFLSTSIDCQPMSLQRKTRSITDILSSRQHFDLSGMPNGFVIERGRIASPRLVLFREVGSNDYLGIIRESEQEIDLVLLSKR